MFFENHFLRSRKFRHFIELVIFVAVAYSIIFLVHAYIFFRLSDFLGVPRAPYLTELLIILSASFILANIVERTISSWLGRAVYMLASVWLGFVFITFFTTALGDLAALLGAEKWTAGIVAIISGFLLSAFSIFNALALKERKITIKLEGLHEKVRAVHLSDIHLGAIRNAEYAEELAQRIGKIKPDVVFITGDLADGSGDFSLSTILPFNQVDVPIFYVTGNHENYLGKEKVIGLVAQTKIRRLHKEVVDFKGLQVVGFDYPFEDEAKKLAPMLKTVKLKKNKPAVLLYHAPEFLEEASRKGFSLMLVGHVHGGQVMPFGLFVRMAFKYTRGLHDYNGMKVLVSTGAGTWGPPMRLGSSNEMVVLDLVPAK